MLYTLKLNTLIFTLICIYCNMILVYAIEATRYRITQIFKPKLLHLYQKTRLFFYKNVYLEIYIRLHTIVTILIINY